MSEAPLGERIATRLETSWLGRPLVARRSVSSTMDLARELAREGPSRGRVVVADAQTRGRGRAGRRFVSPAGGLYVTAELAPLDPLGDSWRLGLCAALAVRDAILACGGEAPRLSWPNDLFDGERKVAGVLVELVTVSGGPACALVGAGVNVAAPAGAFDVPEAGPAGTVRRLGGGDPAARLGAELLGALERLDETVRGRQGWPRVLESVRGAMTGTFGRRVRVRAPDGREIRGRARDVAADGALLVDVGGGQVQAVRHGEIEAD